MNARLDGIRDCGIDVDPVLPLELGPHAPELRFVACSRFDIVHDVDMDITEDDTCLGGA